MTRSPATVLFVALLGLELSPAPARANGMASVGVDSQGRVFFSDYLHNRVWRIGSDQELTAWVKRKHTHHLVLDENGTLYGENVPSGGGTPSLWQMTAEGVLTEIFRATRKGHAVNYQGTVFTIDRSGNLGFLRDCQLVRVSPDGRLTPWAGRRCSGDVWGSDTLRYGHLHGCLAWGPGGDLFFSDARTVRRVSPDGTVSTLAGKTTTLFADPQPGEERLARVVGLAVGRDGSLFVAEHDTGQVRRIFPVADASTVGKLSTLWSPIGLGISGSDLYVVAQLRAPTPGFFSGAVDNPSVFKISPDGTVARVTTVHGR
ncbi:MAG: hypothetical protein ACRD1P_10785 [Thermoanaerobaculia bacterium]